MTDPDFCMTMAASGLFALGMLIYASLTGWRGWLDLKQRELDGRGGPAMNEPAVPSATTRIEIADLKERIRKLEAIAAGVDL